MGVKWHLFERPTSHRDASYGNMAHVTDGAASRPPGERLAQALEEQGYSLRGFARQLAGVDATYKQIESRRRQLGKWINEGGAINDENAEMLARALGLDADYFKTPKQKRATRNELEQRVATLERDMATLTAIARTIFELNKVAFRALGVKVKLPELPLPPEPTPEHRPRARRSPASSRTAQQDPVDA